MYFKLISSLHHSLRLTVEVAYAYRFSRPGDDSSRYIFDALGNLAATLPPLRRSLELDPENYLALIPTDPDFDPVRDDPAFQALLAEFADQA